MMVEQKVNPSGNTGGGQKVKQVEAKNLISH